MNGVMGRLEFRVFSARQSFQEKSIADEISAEVQDCMMNKRRYILSGECTCPLVGRRFRA